MAHRREACSRSEGIRNARIRGPPEVHHFVFGPCEITGVAI